MLGIGIISVAPAVTALFTPAARKFLSKEVYGWLLTLLVTVLFVWLLSYLPRVTEEGSIEFSLAWLPQLGLYISLYLDGLSLLFGLIVLGIGAVITLYATYYIDDVHELSRFYVLLLGFMSAMLALVLAGNILTLFIAWELTSILSFLLISFHGENAEARTGALRALIITGGGGLALLAGVALMGSAAGSHNFSDILTSTTLREHPLYAAFTILILAGCFSKSAQFPLHFWLPGAMSAPTPASAYLHSATMVKAGIYLLLRLSPALGDTLLWQYSLMGFGLATMLVGALLALRQTDLKAALAYSTVSQLGALVALIGLPNGAGLEAALVGVLAHSLYKAALFLVAGAVDHAAGTRDLRQLGGLAASMPGWAVVCALAGLSMAGVPPLLGFVAKEALLHAVEQNPLALIVVVTSAALTVTMALILVWDVFVKKAAPHHIHAPAQPMLYGPGLLAVFGLLAGLALDGLVRPLMQPALTEEFHLTLFSGFNLPLLLSVVAIAVGGGVFMLRERWRGWSFPHLPSGDQLYNLAISGVERAGDVVLRSQNGSLRNYLSVILGAVVMLLATPGFAYVFARPMQWTWNGETDLLRGLLLLLSLGAMTASIFIRSHLMAALALALAGYSVGGLFLLEPAPDVALVQFMVETFGTVLLILMLAKISAPQREAAMNNLWKLSRGNLARDIVLAVLLGGAVGLFALAAVNHRGVATTVTTWHLENALPLLGFPDVVGAIVTDFRGMDTIIEITVFSVAGLGTLTLLAKSTQTVKSGPFLLRPLSRTVIRRFRGVELTPQDIHHGEDEALHPTFDSRFSTPLTRTIAQLMLPFAFLVALSQLLYGGEGPGDGFTAGVISGLGVALWYLVFGYEEAQGRLGWLKPRYLIGSGLTLVIANAFLPLVLGQPFLAHVSFDIALPANLHLSTTLIYETGIFLTVLGSSTTIMEAIAYPKEVEAL